MKVQIKFLALCVVAHERFILPSRGGTRHHHRYDHRVGPPTLKKIEASKDQGKLAGRPRRGLDPRLILDNHFSGGCL